MHAIAPGAQRPPFQNYVHNEIMYTVFVQATGELFFPTPGIVLLPSKVQPKK